MSPGAKGTLVHPRGNVLSVSIFPHKYVNIDISGMWFLRRMHGWEVTIVEFHPDRIVIVFRRPKQKHRVKGYVGVDMNFDTLDFSSPQHGWVRMDIRPLVHVIQAYDGKESRVRSLTKRVPGYKGTR